MMKHHWLVLLVFALHIPISAGAAWSVDVLVPLTPVAVDLLLAGDSITEGYPYIPGFRQPLYDALSGNPLHTFTFVGSSGSPPPGPFPGRLPIEAFYPAFGGTGRSTRVPIHPPGTPGLIAIHLGTNDLNSQPGPYGEYSPTTASPQ
jgi:hypothetical protein